MVVAWAEGGSVQVSWPGAHRQREGAHCPWAQHTGEAPPVIWPPDPGAHSQRESKQDGWQVLNVPPWFFPNRQRLKCEVRARNCPHPHCTEWWPNWGVLSVKACSHRLPTCSYEIIHIPKQRAPPWLWIHPQSPWGRPHGKVRTHILRGFIYNLVPGLPLPFPQLGHQRPCI